MEMVLCVCCEVLLMRWTELTTLKLSCLLSGELPVAKEWYDDTQVNMLCVLCIRNQNGNQNCLTIAYHFIKHTFLNPIKQSLQMSNSRQF